MGKASRKKAEQKTSNPPQQVLDNVLNSALDAIHALTGKKGIRVQHNLLQQEKISHALSELLRNEVSQDAPLAEYKTALDFIVIAWNISLLKTSKHSAEIQKIIDACGNTDSSILRNAHGQIKRLIAKKKAFFPDDKRTVVSWNVRFEGNSFGVTAAALVP